MRNSGLSLIIARWWWRRFHWLVRLGWINVKGGAFGNAGLGLGLMAAGLVTRRRQRQTHLRTRVFIAEPPQSMRITVRRIKG